jgi:pyruvate carboxylase subunit B
MFGAWKKIAEGYGKMVLGYFGKTPVTPDQEIIDIASQQLKLPPTSEKTVDIDDKDPKKGIAAAKKMLSDAGITDITDEKIFITAACKDKGITFLKGEAKVGVRKESPAKAATPEAAKKTNDVTVTINGKPYAVHLENDKATVNGMSYDYSVKAGIDEAGQKAVTGTGDATPVNSPLPGGIFKILVAPSQQVSVGDVLLIIEAMKMETEIKAPKAGKIISVAVKQGDQVATGQELVKIL